MKQRLLLALLMLLTSAGFMKAQTTVPNQTINVVIPATPDGEKTVTITFTGAFGDQSYPDLVQGTASSEAIGADKKSYTYTFKSKEDASIGNLSFATAYAEAWGNVTITVDGPVSSFIVGEGNTAPAVTDIESQLPLLPHVTSIAFTNNGGNLGSLKLGENAGLLNYFKNLEAFACPNNQLTYIPAKPENMSSEKYNVGTVKPVIDLSLTDNAKSFKLVNDQLFTGVYANLATSVTSPELEIITLKDENGTVLSDVIADKVNSVWHFKNNEGIYVNGTYKADIQISEENKTYPGVIFSDVTLIVEPATFNLTFLNPDKTQGECIVKSPAQTNNLKKGDLVVIIPNPNTENGYKFSHFESLKGLVQVESNEDVTGNEYRFEVKGDVDPEIKAVFVKGNVKVEFNANNYNGKIAVYKGANYTGADALASGAELLVGSEISIVAEVYSSDYSIKDVTLNGTSIMDKNTSEITGVYKATIKVPVDGAKILVTFSGNSSLLSIKRPTGIWKTFVVKDDAGTEYCKTEANGYFVQVVPAGTHLTLSMELANSEDYAVSSVLVNGIEQWSFTKLPDNGMYVVKDFYMPNNDVKLVVNVNDLMGITPSLVENSFVYDGLPKSVAYTTAPAGVTGIELSYMTNASDTHSTEEPYINVGTYNAHFEREADVEYKSLNVNVPFEITKAPLYITKLPVVIKNEDGTFDIQGGEVKYRQGNGFCAEPVSGEFEITNSTDPSYVVVNFNPTDNSNFSNIPEARVYYGDAATNTVDVEIVNDNSIGGEELLLLNGDAVVSNGTSVVDKTVLKFDILNKDENLTGKYSVYLADESGEHVTEDNLLQYNTNGFTVDKNTHHINRYVFQLQVLDDRKELRLSDLEETDYTAVYTESAISYPVKGYIFDKVKTTENVALNSLKNWSDDQVNWEVSYYNSKNVKVANAVNADTYTVKIVRKATTGLHEFETTCTMEIKKADITAEIPLPTATAVTKGSSLISSSLDGPVEIAGEYKFYVDDPFQELTSTKSFPVKFVSKNSNYNEYVLNDLVEVPVKENALLHIGYDGYGTIEVYDDAGNRYWGGNEVISGTKLTVKAVPATDCELVSITKNGQSMSNPFTFEFGDEPVSIYATFKVKEVEVEVPGEPEIDEDSQYTITLPTSLVGAKLSKTGVYSVKRGGSFSFSVATLPADASKVVVKIGNVTIKPSSSGVYTLSDITSNYTVSVSLPNPTEIKLNVPTEYKNKGGYLMGRVQVQGPRSSGKFYYNDEVTLIAFPESGVKFAGWTGDVSGLTQVKEIVLTKDLSVKATFSGTPTGIEDIMAASITTGKGCVWVRGIANADVTIVSIAGRVQAQERISGDTRIDVPAGIYVVVLESGSDVKRVKVIVK